jgi:hypothetical protein
MNRITFFSIIFFASVISSCGSNSDNESLSNPRQTDDKNARNEEAAHIEDSSNNAGTMSAGQRDSARPRQ